MAASVACSTVIARVTASTLSRRCAGASAWRTPIRLRRSASLIRAHRGARSRGRRQSRWDLPGRSSIRCSATSASASVSGSTVIWLTTWPATRFSSAQTRCGQVDAVHRRAVADVAVEEDDRLVGVGVGEALDEVELGADRPDGAGLGGLDGLDDELGRADQVGLEHDLVRALGVDEDVDAGVLRAQLVDDVLGEAAVHRAVALPEDHPGPLRARRR